MRKRVVVVALVSVAAVALVGYLLYGVVDQAVSLAYARAAQTYLEEDRELLRQLAVDFAKGPRRRELEDLIQRKYRQGHLVKEEDGALFVDSVGLRFRGDELVAIEFMNERDNGRRQR